MSLRACGRGDPVLLQLVARAAAEVPAWGVLVVAARRDPRPFLIYEEDTAAVLLWATRGPCQRIDGLHAAPEHADVAGRALAALVAHLRTLPETVAIVAPEVSGARSLSVALGADGFELVERRALVQELARADLGAPPLDPAVRLGAWDDAAREPAARLVAAANRGRVDGVFLAPPALATLATCRDVVARVAAGAYGELLPDVSAVALAGDVLVGVVLVIRETSSQVHLFELAVAAEYAGRGLAHALVRHVQRRALAAGMRTLRFSHCAGNRGVTRLFRDEEIVARTSERWLVWIDPRNDDAA